MNLECSHLLNCPHRVLSLTLNLNILDTRLVIQNDNVILESFDSVENVGKPTNPTFIFPAKFGTSLLKAEQFVYDECEEVPPPPIQRGLLVECSMFCYPLTSSDSGSAH